MMTKVLQTLSLHSTLMPFIFIIPALKILLLWMKQVRSKYLKTKDDREPSPSSLRKKPERVLGFIIDYHFKMQMRAC